MMPNNRAAAELWSKLASTLSCLSPVIATVMLLHM